MPSVLVRAALVTAVTLGLGSVSCGGEDDATAGSDQASNPVEICRAQWDDVAANIVGLDEDEHPSALARRWSNIAATVTIYQETQTADGCQENIETLSAGITALRQFSVRLQPYDMEFQADEVADEVARYLAEPLPAPVGTGKKAVRPPSKFAVSTALATLTTQSATANTDLAPPWGQLNAVELTDTAAVDSALQDLAFFARDSTAWVACQQALKVIRAAIAAMPEASATPTPTQTPSGTPSGTPTGTPTGSPTGSPTGTPSGSPTGTPSATP